MEKLSWFRTGELSYANANKLGYDVIKVVLPVRFQRVNDTGGQRSESICSGFTEKREDDHLHDVWYGEPMSR
jgi:hypothetical protein